MLSSSVSMDFTGIQSNLLYLRERFMAKTTKRDLSAISSDKNQRGMRKRRKTTGETEVKRVIDHIQRQIASGNLEGGDLLVEGALAATLRLSRQPVREALAILDNQGLVERIPRYGSRIRETTWEQVREILALRSVCESLVVSVMASKPDGDRMGCVKQLRRLIEETKEHMDKAQLAQEQVEKKYSENVVRSLSPTQIEHLMDQEIKDAIREHSVRFTAGDSDFHSAMAELAGFSLWAGIFRSFRHKVMVHQLRTMPTVEQMKHILQEHDSILQAIQDGNEEQAKERIFVHLERIAERYFRAHTSYVSSLRRVVIGSGNAHRSRNANGSQTTKYLGESSARDSE
jgi:DNA-binding GntR family transcriptional regulator